MKPRKVRQGMSDTITLNYYNSNAVDFSEITKNVDFSEVQMIFMNHLPPDASILDFGCGSGRDAKYFLKHHYRVTAADGSEEMCKIATDFAGIPVKRLLFEELDERNQYDGIWACASILHVRKEELPDIFYIRKSLWLYTFPETDKMMCESIITEDKELEESGYGQFYYSAFRKGNAGRVFAC